MWFENSKITIVIALKFMYYWLITERGLWERKQVSIILLLKIIKEKTSLFKQKIMQA